MNILMTHFLHQFIKVLISRLIVVRTYDSINSFKPKLQAIVFYGTTKTKNNNDDGISSTSIRENIHE